MRQSTVDTPAAERVGIRLGTLENLLGTDIVGPHISISQEETLRRSEAIAGLQTILLSLGSLVVAECEIRNLQTAVVSDVLAEREGTVGVYARSNLNAVEGLLHHLSTQIEGDLVLRLPPILHIAILVELAALVIKTVGHLVADNHTDCAVVECIVCAHIEERILENTGWTDCNRH